MIPKNLTQFLYISNKPNNYQQPIVFQKKSRTKLHGEKNRQQKIHQAKVPSASCGVARAGSVTATRREAARNGRPNVLRKPGWQHEMSDTLAAVWGWIFGWFFP